MINIQGINQILNAIGRRDGLNNLALDEQGCAGICLSDGVSLFFEWVEASQQLFIYTPLSLPEHLPLERACSQLLRLNCLSEGPVVAMHPARDELLMQLALAGDQLQVEKIDRAINQLTASRNLLYAQPAETKRPVSAPATDVLSTGSRV